MFASLIFSLIFLGIGLSSVTDIEDGLINQAMKLSYNQCIEKCESSLKCVSLKYYHRFTLCKLFETELPLSPKQPEYDVYQKSSLRRKEHQDKYQQCNANDADMSTSCTPLSCPPPSANISGATMKGNMFNIGAVIKYQCIDTKDYVTSTCFPNGTWSPVLLSCECKKTSMFDYEVISMNSTTIEVNQTCPESSNLMPSIPSTCDLATGIWNNQHLSCCESINSSWSKVFEISPSTGIFVKSAWNGFDTRYEFRSPLIDNWDSINVSQVQIVVHKAATVAVSLLFNGCNTNKYDWFSLERLIDSPWNDNLRTSSVDHFSLGGNMFDTWFQISNASLYGQQSTGWFAVSKWSEITATWNVEILYNLGIDPILYTDMERGDNFVVLIKHP